jgi:hypothetical protein
VMQWWHCNLSYTTYRDMKIIKLYFSRN